MTTLNVADNRTTPNGPDFIETTETMMDSTFLKSLPMKSLFLKGLQSMVGSDKTSKITEVYRSGMCSVPQYSMADVSEHCDGTSCWIVVSDKIYDVTEFLSKHPGGIEIILEHAGHDATIPFESKGHSNMAYTLMEQYCVGHLIEKDRRFKPKETTTKM